MESLRSSSILVVDAREEAVRGSLDPNKDGRPFHHHNRPPARVRGRALPIDESFVPPQTWVGLRTPHRLRFSLVCLCSSYGSHNSLKSLHLMQYRRKTDFGRDFYRIPGFFVSAVSPIQAFRSVSCYPLIFCSIKSTTLVTALYQY